MRRICIGPRYRTLSLDTCAAPRASTDFGLKNGKGNFVYIVTSIVI
jgi:hypothetical protein